VLDAVCEETAQALSVPAVCVFLCDEQRQKLIIAALTGLPAKYQTDYVPTPLTRYEEHVRKLGPTIVVPDVQAEPGLPNHALYAEMDVRTAASASLLHERQFIGTLTALTIGRERRFSGDDLALLQGLADQAVMAIVNARLYAAQRGINAQLQMALRAKDEMIQNVSHELRTPLALMHGYAELMEAEGLGPLTAEQQRAASVMLAQGKRLRFMVDRLLTLQSFSADKLNRGALELGPWLSQVMEAWSYRAADKGFRFEVDAPPDLPPVNADSNYLNEVIENLADNAVKFSPQGGVVRISAWATEGEVVVAVADEGIGIDPEDLPRLFERFYQVDGSTTRMYGGMGIGLALCQAIVDAHGGRIWAESAGKGQGSTFFIALPVCERS